MHVITNRRVGGWLTVMLSVASLSTAGDPRLVSAVKNGDKKTVRALLKQDVDVTAAQGDGATPPAWASHLGDVETAELLIAAGANVNTPNDYGVTPLQLACGNGSAAMGEVLLKAGADANLAKPTGETPLMTAARTGSVDLVRSLLAHGATVNSRENHRGQTPLMWAVAERHADIERDIAPLPQSAGWRRASADARSSVGRPTYTRLAHGERSHAVSTDDRLRSIDDYLSASDVFPGVGLKGGVCYFLWDRDNPGTCRVATHFKDEPPSTASRQLLEEGVDVFIRFNEGLAILKKVVAIESEGAKSLSLPEKKRFDQLVSSRKPFGLETTFKGKMVKDKGDILVYQNGRMGYIPKSSISTGVHLIGNWKVYTGRAAPGTGNRDTYPHRILSTPFIGKPNTISSETYLCIGPFGTQSEAESVLSYLSCRLTRLLILLHKPSQDTTRKVYSFVPTQKWTKRWTDEALYAKYGLSATEIAFVEKLVRPMNLDSGDDE